MKWPSNKGLAKKRRNAKAVSQLNRLCRRKDEQLKKMTALKRKYQRKCSRLQKALPSSKTTDCPPSLPTTPPPSESGDAPAGPEES